MTHDNFDQQQRQTYLPLILGTATVAGVVLFLILITVGYFIYVLLAVVLLGGVGLMHYLMWGHGLDADTEGEREEERLREESEADPW